MEDLVVLLLPEELPGPALNVAEAEESVDSATVGLFPPNKLVNEARPRDVVPLKLLLGLLSESLISGSEIARSDRNPGPAAPIPFSANVKSAC